MSKSGGSKADTAVKLVLIFFISLLSFTVGTLVGGQFEKSKSHQLTLETEGGAGHASAEAEHGDQAAAPINEEEIDGLEDFVNNDRKVASAEEHGAAPAAAAHGAEAAHGAPAAEHGAPAAKPADGYTHASQIREHGAPAAKAPAHGAAPTVTEKAVAHMAPQVQKATAAAQATNKEVENAADRLAHDKAPTADVKKPRAPSSALPVVASTVIGKYTVQVASYGTEKEASAHAVRLKDKGYDSFYLPAQVDGKTWYRVSVGRFDDAKTAGLERKKIQETAPSAIVQKIVK